MSESSGAANNWNDRVISEFRAGNERIVDMFDRSGLLLLHTTGARTGAERVSPLAYLRDGESVFVAGSAAGRDQHPAWYFNLKADPRVGVELWDGDQLVRFDAEASETEGAERDRIWAWWTQRLPGFLDYEKQTSRVIPMIRLVRVEPA